MIRSLVSLGEAPHTPSGSPGWRRSVIGGVVAVIGVVAVTAAMLPLRGHVDTATTALVMVLPVLTAVVVSGFVGGIVAIVAGFFASDLLFVPPYDTIQIRAAQDWTTLIVYVLAMVVVARLVDHLRTTQIEARRHEQVIRRIFDMSEALIRDRPFDEFLGKVTSTFLEAFELRSVAMLLPVGPALEVVSTAGVELSPDELADLTPAPGALRRPAAVHVVRGTTVIVPLSTAAGPLGLLALVGAKLPRFDGALLQTYANQVALALERAQLREQAFKSQLLEEVDRLRDALVGAVSHDLRTPLAVIKAAVSHLLSPEVTLDDSARGEMLRHIDDQTDRLTRLIVNVLDMTRIRAGALTPRIEAITVADLLAEALAALPPEISARVVADIPDPVQVASVDHVLISQAIANLLDNADRHAPGDTPITVAASADDGAIRFSVSDRGPGVPFEDRDRIFDMFNRVSGAGRAGLGLAIAKAFIQAHGGAIEVANIAQGGACFTFEVPQVR
ncbi:MAG TPA: ATP-binding protein [Acidimicrobiales bacterium]|jgi:two-component system sensor histidine kinase KdpD|nr:ATP-binding protein [Acidimicrobiales bacterium]